MAWSRASSDAGRRNIDTMVGLIDPGDSSANATNRPLSSRFGAFDRRGAGGDFRFSRTGALAVAGGAPSPDKNSRFCTAPESH